MWEFSKKFTGVVQCVRFPSEIGLEQRSLFWLYFFQRFGRAHHEFGCRCVRSAKRAARQGLEREKVGEGNPCVFEAR
jgi:hypothetical protein